MVLNDFIKNFAEQLDETSLSELSASTNYRELEDWSSITALSILAMIDEEYGVVLKADEMRKTTTIQELFDLVSSKL